MKGHLTVTSFTYDHFDLLIAKKFMFKPIEPLSNHSDDVKKVLKSFAG